MDELEQNPFSLLFPSISAAKIYQESRTNSSPVRKPEPDDRKSPKREVSKDVHELNEIIEEIFLITLNKFSVVGGPQKQLIHLASLSDIIGKVFFYRVSQK